MKIIDQRKIVDALLLSEAIFSRLGSLMIRFLLAVGNGLRSFAFGRNGRRLLTSREIYARNVLKYWKEDGRNRSGRGLYIGRIGRHYSDRRLRIGQDPEVLR